MHRTLLPVVAVFAALLATAIPEPASAQSKEPPTAKAAPAGLVNINTASASDLQTLPGVGAKTAERIVEYRQKNGPFKKVEDLMNVRGVGEKNFLKLKSQITVSTSRPDQSSRAR
jgi:competence protein ComEA